MIRLNPDGSLDQVFATPTDAFPGQLIAGYIISSVRLLSDSRIATAAYNNLYLFNAEGTINATHRGGPRGRALRWKNPDP